MNDEFLNNPFLRKIKVLTNFLLLSLCLNAIFLLLYLFNFTENHQKNHSKLPEEVVKKEYADLLQGYFQKKFSELASELSNKELISDGYKICDLAIGIMSSYHYLDLSKALMGETLEEREISFVHRDGGEVFSLSLYPDLKEYHYSLIKAYIDEYKYPFTTEGLFAEIKIQKNNAPTDLISSFMISKEFTALYTFINRFFNCLEKEELLYILSMGSYKDIEKFYYLYLENMEKPLDVARYFFKTYCSYNCREAAALWISIDQEYVLHQLDNIELSLVLNLVDNKDFLEKLYKSSRGIAIRKIAAKKLHISSIIDLPQKVNNKFTNEYTVKKGDSFWKIANHHNISIEDLKKANKFPSEILQPGQKMVIPKK